MKQIELKNPRYQADVNHFRKWLATLNYSPETVYYSPNSIKEFLQFIEQKECYDYKIISSEIIAEFINMLGSRSHQRRSGGLSFSSLNKHLHIIKKYIKFLEKNEVYLQHLEYPFIKSESKIPQILTLEEIKLLFKYCTKDIKGKRDKAMLSLYYGCGLRKVEGIRLNVEDIDFNKGLLFVRKSKTHRQRYVPISKTSIKHFEDYLYNSRELLLPSEHNESAFLVNSQGKRYTSPSPPYILNRILARIDRKELTQKTSLHVLRHSIATHLLQAGMTLENIALFLGHSSLDSTQIYTHISNQKR